MSDLTITVHYDIKEITEGNRKAAASFTEVEKSASKLNRFQKPVRLSLKKRGKEQI